MSGPRRGGYLQALAAAASLLLLASPLARACAVCAPSAPLTVAQRLIDAERAVLAYPDPGRAPGWRVEAVVRGEAVQVAPEFDPTAAAIVARSDSQGRPFLLVRDRLTKSWSVAGPIAVAHLDWLRELAAYPRTASMTAQDWTHRVAALVPLLEHPEPLVAETAYGEIARAPYAAMRANRESLDRARLARWVEDPTLAARRPLYLLLLGLVGGPADAARIERTLAAHRPGADTVDLPALLAAELELRGAARLPWIEKTWLLDPGRSPAEARAAIIALSVLGGEGVTLSREAVADAFLRFAQRRGALGGWVAQDLAAWGVWDATPVFAARVGSPEVPVWSRLAMLQYLRGSPRPEAKVALERVARVP